MVTEYHHRFRVSPTLASKRQPTKELQMNPAFQITIIIIGAVLLGFLARYIWRFAKERRQSLARALSTQVILASDSKNGHLKPVDANEMKDASTAKIISDMERFKSKAEEYERRVEDISNRYALLIMDKIHHYATEKGYMAGAFYIDSSEVRRLPKTKATAASFLFGDKETDYTIDLIGKRINQILRSHHYNSSYNDQTHSINAKWSEENTRWLQKYVALDTVIA